MSILAGKIIIYTLECPRCGWERMVYSEKVGVNTPLAICKAKVKAKLIFAAKPKKCPECGAKLKQVITPGVS